MPRRATPAPDRPAGAALPAAECAARLRAVMADPEGFSAWFGKSAVVDRRGLPRVVHHGTRASFETFRPHHRRKEMVGFGIHFAEKASFAERYALDENIPRRGKAPRTIAALLSIQRPLLADRIISERDPEFALVRQLGKHFGHPDGGVLHGYLQHALDLAPPERTERVLRDAGYDGVRYVSTLAGSSGQGRYRIDESVSWVVFDPSQVRVLSDPAGRPLG